MTCASSFPSLLFSLVDRLYFLYLAAIAALALWTRHGGIRIVLWHCAIALVIIFLAATRDRSLAFRFVHDWYPLGMFIFSFEEVARFSLAVVPNWQDFRIIALEHRIFGASPNLWLMQFGSRPLSELMDLGYFSYYPLIPVVAGTLYGRNEKARFHWLMLASVIMYLISFSVYLTFPMQSPRHSLPGFQPPQHGFVFSWLVGTIQHGAGVRGNALPSSHVALAVLCAIAARGRVGPLAPCIAVSVCLICAGAVYDGYHYVSDVFTGILVALTSAAVASLIVSLSCKFNKALGT